MWWLKIFVKLCLARLPIGYSLWRALSIYRHGMMDDPRYLFRTTNSHLNRLFHSNKGVQGASILELGPGDSIGTAIIINAYGGHATLVDEVPAATVKPSVYQHIESYVLESGVSTKLKVMGNEEFPTLLKKFDCKYLTSGLASLRTLQTESFDGIFSQAVLEHVEKATFQQVMNELFRVSKKGSLSSHRVDLKDHLSGSLNNLRFSNWIWESKPFQNSGFYTNRLRFSEHINAFEAAGFEILRVDVDRWNSLPLDKSKIHSDFSHFTEEELMVSGFTVLLRKN